MKKQSTGEFLAALRKDAGFTQQDVADKLNISDRTLSSWETGRTEPDLSSLSALATLYGVTVDEVLRGERRAREVAPEKEISEREQKNLYRNKFTKYNGKRILCLGLSYLCAFLFLAGCSLICTPYKSSLTWLSILFIVVGAGGNFTCVTLLFYFDYTVMQNAEPTFSDDCENKNYAFTLAVRHKSAAALMFNSLPYIVGLVTFLVTSIIIYVGLEVDFGIAFGLCTAAGNLLLVSGAALSALSVKKCGNSEQKTAHTKNAKLFCKLCCFGAIPVIITAVLSIVFGCTNIDVVQEVIFTAESADEIRERFQTYTFTEDTGVFDDEENKFITEIEKGEYFLNFQTEDYFECTYADEGVTRFYDLGNGFYGMKEYGTVEDSGDCIVKTFTGWAVFYLQDGKSVTGIKREENYSDYLSFANSFSMIYFQNAQGDYESAVNAAYIYNYDDYYWKRDKGVDYRFEYRVTYDNDDGLYYYAQVCRYNLFLLFLWISLSTTAATAISCTIVYIARREKISYDF